MKAARYFVVGATHSTLAKRQDHTFYLFGEVSGAWKQSALAVNLVLFEVAKEIPKSDAEAFAKSKFPGADVSEWF